MKLYVGGTCVRNLRENGWLLEDSLAKMSPIDITNYLISSSHLRNNNLC